MKQPPELRRKPRKTRPASPKAVSAVSCGGKQCSCVSSAMAKFCEMVLRHSAIRYTHFTDKELKCRLDFIFRISAADFVSDPALLSDPALFIWCCGCIQALYSCCLCIYYKLNNFIYYNLLKQQGLFHDIMGNVARIPCLVMLYEGHHRGNKLLVHLQQQQQQQHQRKLMLKNDGESPESVSPPSLEMRTPPLSMYSNPLCSLNSIVSSLTSSSRPIAVCLQ